MPYLELLVYRFNPPTNSNTIRNDLEINDTR